MLDLGRWAKKDMVREILSEMSELLERHNASSNTLFAALHGDEEKLWSYLVSNDLWGGAGSVADQALLEMPEDRKKLDTLMIRLGREQLKIGRVNVRTEGWLAAFEKWHAENLR
jgi:hypothetical protein